MNILMALAYIILAPLVGGIVVGIDRRITARMQGRVGPPLLQPIYDILKLFEKDKAIAREEISFYAFCYLIFMVFTGALFFLGGDLLLVIFALTLAHVFLILAAYAAGSPYSFVGAERELIMVMAVEPMLIFVAVGFYMVTGSFDVGAVVGYGTSVIVWLPLLFIGFLYILTLKLRKSPFDISTSHHAHQELVKGLTTEFAGPTFGMVELAHLYETILMLGIVWLFFAADPLIGILVVVVVYLLELFIDNATARVKWPLALRSCWIAAIVFGVVNLAAIAYMGGVI